MMIHFGNPCVVPDAAHRAFSICSPATGILDLRLTLDLAAAGAATGAFSQDAYSSSVIGQKSSAVRLDGSASGKSPTRRAGAPSNPPRSATSVTDTYTGDRVLDLERYASLMRRTFERRSGMEVCAGCATVQGMPYPVFSRRKRVIFNVLENGLGHLVNRSAGVETMSISRQFSVGRTMGPRGENRLERLDSGSAGAWRCATESGDRPFRTISQSPRQPRATDRKREELPRRPRRVDPGNVRIGDDSSI
jgi:hypothetical protein